MLQYLSWEKVFPSILFLEYNMQAAFQVCILYSQGPRVYVDTFE